MPAIVHLTKRQWKLFIFYTLQKENLKASGLFTASGLTIIESDFWSIIQASSTLVNIQG
jgi:hypothetical protein